MGGYRSYRPLIIRRDTILPVLMLIYFCWGVSSIMMLNCFKGKNKFIFISYLSLLSVFYFYSDKMPDADMTNKNEKAAFKKIGDSNDSCAIIERNCSILAWGYTDDCSHSLERAEMLYYWNITSKKTKFYQPEIK